MLRQKLPTFHTLELMMKLGQRNGRKEGQWNFSRLSVGWGCGTVKPLEHKDRDSGTARD